MRRVLYSVAMSLDGYIARPNGDFDWIPSDSSIDWNVFMNRFDTVLMGRNTYEITSRQAGGGMPNMQVYVFSRTLPAADSTNITIAAEDAAGVVEDLKKREGKDIWLMGGGVLFRSLLDARLVDAIEIGIVPILLGDGIPLLPHGATTTRLTLTHSKTHPSGIAILTYDVLQ